MPSNADYDHRPYLVAPTVFATRTAAVQAMRPIKESYVHTRMQLDLWGVVSAVRSWPPVEPTGPHAGAEFARAPPESLAQMAAAGRTRADASAYLHAVVSAAGTEAHFRKLADDPRLPPESRKVYLKLADRARTLPDDVEERFALIAREKDAAGFRPWPDSPHVHFEGELADDRDLLTQVYVTRAGDRRDASEDRQPGGQCRRQ